MNTPITALLNWLRLQEEGVQEDIAFMMAGHDPAFDFTKAYGERNEILEYFYKRIDDFSGDEINSGGFVISFRAIFDFVFVRKRGTDKGWDEVARLHQSIIDSDEADMPSGMKEKARQHLDGIPALRDKWRSICESWKELVSGPLSDEAIEDWERDNFITRHDRIKKSAVRNIQL